MQEAVGTQLLLNYIGRQQGAVAQWVDLQTIFYICAEKKGYEVGGLGRDTWWRQETTETQLRLTLDEILQEARMIRQGNRGTL